MNREWISARACVPGEAVAHERPVNSRTTGDDRRLEVIVATLVFDLHDHGLDPFVLLGVDSALSRLHARRAVTHAALSRARDRSHRWQRRERGWRERRLRVRNRAEMLDPDRAVHLCSRRAEHAEELEQLGSLARRELVERALARADQGADGADLRRGRDRLGARPLRQLRNRGPKPLAGLEQPFEIGVEVR